MASEALSLSNSRDRDLVSDTALLMLEDLARLDGVPVHDVLERLVWDQWGQRIMDAHNATYAALRDDPVAWSEEQAERAVYDGALAEGGFRRVSYIKCEDVRSVSQDRLVSRWGRATPATLLAVSLRLRHLMRL